MEKIKRALEKARQQREYSTGQSRSEHVPSSGSVSKEGIRYTTTRSIDSSPEIMHEHRLVTTMGNTEYADALKILSAQVLRRMTENDWKTIAVTSPRRHAGNSTMAVNLGLSIAMEVEYTVLIVDANLKRPNIHNYFGIQPDVGLADYLSGDIELSDCLINPKGINHFVILPAGKEQTSSAELLGSPKMASLVSELNNRYPKRIVIFDVPSVLDTADTLNFVPCVDCCLLVLEDDETKVSDVSTAVEILSSTNIIGTVLNKSVT